MKKFKYVLLISLLFIVSGCTATYEVNLNDDKVIENLKISETNKQLFDSVGENGLTLRQNFKELAEPSIYSDHNYNVKVIEKEDELGLEYSSSSANSIINSSIIQQCYINPNVKVIDDVVTINTGSNFKCFQYYDILESVKVVFKTNHEVISTNADEVDGDSYIWNFNKNSNKQIKISYYESKVKKEFNPLWVIISIISIGLVSVLVLFIITKSKNNNKI